MSKSRDRHVRAENAGTPEYKETLEKITQEDQCPFCSERLLSGEYHKEPILREGDCWRVTKNSYSYKKAKYAFLLIIKAHKEDINELTPAEKLELFDLLWWLRSKYNIPGATFFIRAGDKTYTGATVTHLHAHLVSGTGDPNAEPVMARIG